ncbi:MAG: hypothetical protein ABSG36_19875 [Acidimicrobiales bacterium]|jgi:hypothetical protein
MTPDFRSEKMPSQEGMGRARKAWDAYARTVNKAVPSFVVEGLASAVTPGAAYVSREIVQNLLGFWLLWHVQGGFEGLQRFGMSRSTIYKKISRFRQAFGMHPDEFELPGITIDYEAYWEGHEAFFELLEERRQAGRKPQR